MSWSVNVVLLYSLGEEWLETEDDDVDYAGTSPCLIAINDWLSSQGWVTLVDLGEAVGGMDRHRFGVEMWGAAINRLDIPVFLEFVRQLPWVEPENVQILIKDQQDERFTLYTVATPAQE